MDKKAVVSWSGGKDSYYAALQAKASGIQPVVALNILNEEGTISRSHGIPPALLEAQAEKIGIPIQMVASSWQQYEEKFTTALVKLGKKYSLSHAIFGDIDLQEHRTWEEKVCEIAGLIADLPLWGMDRGKLVAAMLETGMETMIVSCNAVMGERYLGRVLTPELVQELMKQDIDPCGENGEFHTLVTNGPVFRDPLPVAVVGKTMHDGYWYAALELQK
ncbi:MAG: diphthine--ammonia ligase [Chitinophagaceae bacterium]